MNQLAIHQLPRSCIRAAIHTESYKTDDRTVEVIWTTGKGRPFKCFGERFEERLDMRPSAIRLTRLNEGAPVLKDHQRNIDNMIGVVERAWLEDKQGVTQGKALIRLSHRKEVEPILNDIRDGIIKNISVGYFVHEAQEQPIQRDNASSSIRQILITDWEPEEISLVTVPADSQARIDPALQRDQVTDSLSTYPHFLEKIMKKKLSKHEGNDMNEKTHVNENQPCVKKTVSTERQQRHQDSNAQTDISDVMHHNKNNHHTAQHHTHDSVAAPDIHTAIQTERMRVQDIMHAVRAAEVNDPDTQIKHFIEQGAHINTVRSQLLDQLADMSDATLTRSPMRITIGDQEESQTRREGITQALLHRYQPAHYELDDKGKPYVGYSLLELARECLEKKGERTRGLSQLGVAERAMHTTSDFPMILSNVANKTLRSAYTAAPQTFRPFVRETTVSDFKPITRVQIGDAPALQKVNEHGEFSHGSLSEAKERYQVATYGKIISITRQTLINDDLDAFTRIPELFGRAAANLESELVYQVFIQNPKMCDGNPLFSRAHKNITSKGTTLTIDAMGEARQAMRLQTGIDHKNRMNLYPTYLLIPAHLETVAEQFIAQNYQPNEQGKINPFAGKLKLITEPRLDIASQHAWYLLADPAQIDMIELAYLAGNRGVSLETRNGFEIDGMEIKARLDVGAKAIDWRGFYKNTGYSN